MALIGVSKFKYAVKTAIVSKLRLHPNTFYLVLGLVNNLKKNIMEEKLQYEGWEGFKIGIFKGFAFGYNEISIQAKDRDNLHFEILEIMIGFIKLTTAYTLHGRK